MLKQLLITGGVFLLNFLPACIWILGWLVVTTTGEQFSSSFNNMFRRETKMNHLMATRVIFCSPVALFFTDTHDFPLFDSLPAFRYWGKVNPGDLFFPSFVQWFIQNSKNFFYFLLKLQQLKALCEELLSSKTGCAHPRPSRYFCMVIFLLVLQHVKMETICKMPLVYILYDLLTRAQSLISSYWLIVWNKKSSPWKLEIYIYL